ncbi:MAG: DUF192 domain-containing protein [Myxococcota bacterium]|nr:DUF192 domain-containing protein [Myxococcota bacterium]
MRNLQTGAVLATSALHATGFFERMRGLLGRAPLQPGQGMVIEPCNSVHTWFMGYALDLLFLDRDRRVLRVIPALPPWRMSPIVRGAHSVIELPADASLGTLAGHPLALEPQ